MGREGLPASIWAPPSDTPQRRTRCAPTYAGWTAPAYGRAVCPVSEDGRRQNREVELPVNPYVSKRLAILLVPERFLGDIPVASSEGFWDFAEINYAELPPSLRSTACDSL